VIRQCRMTASGCGDCRGDKTALTPVNISGSFRSTGQAREVGSLDKCWEGGGGV
jgi:hypothetical protein